MKARPVTLTAQILIFCITALFLFFPVLNQGENKNALNSLVEILQETDDPQFQLDILRGLSQALESRRQAPMPKDWKKIEKNLGKHPHPEIQALVQSLSLTFGSEHAREALRRILKSSSADLGARRNALESLLASRDPDLPPVLQNLLGDPALRNAALKALAAYQDPQSPKVILELYPTFQPGEKQDALNTLASRVPYAQKLMEAVRKGTVPAQDLTADLVRQIRNLQNPELTEDLRDLWGVARETNKPEEIEQYKRVYRAGGSQPGDASRGRVVYARICQQCHILFDTGGTVGPDLTGSNRRDLDYLLTNIIDPNAVIPNDYRSSTVETKDGRVLTGIIKKEDAQSITIATANETLVLPKDEIDLTQQSQLSMMPEGLLEPLTEQEIRDLIYYLTRPGQVPMPAGVNIHSP